MELERCLAADDCKGDTTRVQMPLLRGLSKAFELIHAILLCRRPLATYVGEELFSS